MKAKLQAVKAALAGIEKQFGKGAAMFLGEAENTTIPVIPTGATGIDVAIGIGGLPRGRVIEMYGPESSGKTTLALHAIAEAQKAGGIAAFIDAEHALDVSYAAALGVQTANLLVSQPDNGEQALEIAETLVRSGAVDIVVVDSVAALVPKAEIEGEMGDAHMGLQARLMSQALRKLTGIVHKSGTVVIFINQLRQKIGVVYGNPEVTTGGNALKFYASVRIEIRRKEPIKQGEEVIGNKTHVKIVKNKVAPPFRKLDVEIFYGRGICRSSDLLDRACEAGIIAKSGSWYTQGDNKLGQGRDKVVQLLNESADLSADLRARLLAYHRVPGAVASEPLKQAA